MPIVKLPNELELGRYRLTARLGQGGMAELFLGRLLGVAGFEKLVAIKRMLPNLSSDPSFVKMFENEGRIAAGLSHPNVCQVYELGESDGQLFLAMEFLRGMPVSEIMPAIPDRPLATQVRFVVGVIVQACEGLHYAHTSMDVDGKPRPIVHRDVSPTNLFVTNEGIVKLLDFGVSKIITDVTMTRAGMLKGKLPYMSPEQVRGEPLDARADIFAIAVVTWEAIAGRALFARESVQDAWRTVRDVVQEEVPRLPGDSPVIAALDAAIRRALDPERERRPASARAFAIDLRRAIQACGDPMSPNEIQSHIAQWLEASLARRSRDLAGVLGRRSDPEVVADHDDPETVPMKAETTLGARLREASYVVRDSQEPSTEELDAAPTLENVDVRAAATIVDPRNPHTVPLGAMPLRPPAIQQVGPPSVEMPSGEVTAPTHPMMQMPSLQMQMPSPQPQRVEWQRAWLPVVVGVFVFAILVGVLMAILLA